MKTIQSILLFYLSLQVTKSHAQLPDGITIHNNSNASTHLVQSIKTITLPNNISLEFTEQGENGGTPVILLHGFSDSRISYETVLSHLPASLHVFAISQRGHGNSSKPETGYDSEDFANDIALFMKEQQIKQAVIVGHSMGSTVAQCFTSKYPSNVVDLFCWDRFQILINPL